MKKVVIRRNKSYEENRFKEKSNRALLREGKSLALFPLIDDSATIGRPQRITRQQSLVKHGSMAAQNRALEEILPRQK